MKKDIFDEPNINYIAKRDKFIAGEYLIPGLLLFHSTCILIIMLINI